MLRCLNNFTGRKIKRGQVGGGRDIGGSKKAEQGSKRHTQQSIYIYIERERQESGGWGWGCKQGHKRLTSDKVMGALLLLFSISTSSLSASVFTNARAMSVPVNVVVFIPSLSFILAPGFKLGFETRATGFVGLPRLGLLGRFRCQPIDPPMCARADECTYARTSRSALCVVCCVLCVVCRGADARKEKVGCGARKRANKACARRHPSTLHGAAHASRNDVTI